MNNLFSKTEKEPNLLFSPENQMRLNELLEKPDIKNNISEIDFSKIKEISYGDDKRE